MSERFEIVEVNPNEVTGGGGCLCSEAKHTDCKGPYAVFFHQEMASNLSPHAVISLSCARAVVAAADGEVLAGGEKGDFDDTPEQEVNEEPTQEDEVPEL